MNMDGSCWELYGSVVGGVGECDQNPLNMFVKFSKINKKCF